MPITDFESAPNKVPHISSEWLKNPENIPHEVIEKYGETTFESIFQRNIEREYIGNQFAHLSVVGRAIPRKPLDTIHISVTGSPSGGVEVQYPVDTDGADTHEITSIKPKRTQIQVLNQALFKYVINTKARILGDDMTTHMESITEASEQLASHADADLLTNLNSLTTVTNHKSEVPAAGVWGSGSGKPEVDIAGAIRKILEQSSVNPNSVPMTGEGGAGKKWTCILPIGVYDKLNTIREIDGVRSTLAAFIADRWSVDFLWSREPFNFTGSTWPSVKTAAFLFPTMDPKVGRFATFDGGSAIPSLFMESTHAGIEVSGNYWMKFIPTPDEDTGVFNTNKRIVKITGIAS